MPSFSRSEHPLLSRDLNEDKHQHILLRRQNHDFDMSGSNNVQLVAPNGGSSTASASTANSLLPVVLLVGAVCAVALVAGLAAFYSIRRRQLKNFNSLRGGMPVMSANGRDKLKGVGDYSKQSMAMGNGRLSVYRSGIWQSVDLGNALNAAPASPMATLSTSSKYGMELEGYEAALGGFDPDAQVMAGVRDQLVASPVSASEEATGASTASNGSHLVMDAEELLPEDVDFYYQPPAPTHGSNVSSAAMANHGVRSELFDGSSAPSPLYHEFPAGEQW